MMNHSAIPNLILVPLVLTSGKIARQSPVQETMVDWLICQKMNRV